MSITPAIRLAEIMVSINWFILLLLILLSVKYVICKTAFAIEPSGAIRFAFAMYDLNFGLLATIWTNYSINLDCFNQFSIHLRSSL